MSPSSTKARLPKQQLAILAICRFAEPIALTSVFPYLPEMIEGFNVPTDDVARWAGITSSVFSLAQAFTGIIWGRAADAFGRKPVLLVGLVGVMIITVAFGLSRTLAWAIVTRSLAGAVSGNVGVLRTTVAELVPEKELQPLAFSLMPLVWGVGSILGPVLGGALAKPAQQYPKLFNPRHLFGTFPYLLPNLVSSVFFLVGIATGFLFLKESLPSRKYRRDFGRSIGMLITRRFHKRQSQMKKSKEDEEASTNLLEHSRTSSISNIPSTPASTARNPPSAITTPVRYAEVFTRQSSLNLLVYAILAFHSIAFDQLIPIFMHHPRRDPNPPVSSPLRFSGGFSLNHQRIGLIFTIYAIFCTFSQFIIYPPAANRFGVLNCFKFISILFPLAYCLTPFTSLIANPIAAQTALCAVMMLKGLAGMFAFPCAVIMITNSASSYRILGTLNGVSTSISALGRAAGPAVGGGAFTLGVKLGYMIIPWWTLAIFAAVGAIPIWWLTENDGFQGADDARQTDAGNGHEEDGEALLPVENETLAAAKDSTDAATVSMNNNIEDPDTVRRRN